MLLFLSMQNFKIKSDKQIDIIHITPDDESNQSEKPKIFVYTISLFYILFCDKIISLEG